MFFTAPENSVTNDLFSDANVVLDFSPVSTEEINIPSVPSVSAINSNCIDTGIVVQTSNKSAKIKKNSSSEISITSTVIVHKPPLSTIPVARAITPAIILKPIHFLFRSE